MGRLTDLNIRSAKPRNRPYKLATANPVREYQTRLRDGLARKLGDVEIAIEWRAMTDEPGVYSPRLDAAVGPFAFHDKLGDQYDAMVKKHSRFLRELFDLHRANLDDCGGAREDIGFEEVSRRNWNSRCFLAFEIENVVSRKHLMGGAINAAALGRIGVAVGWDIGKVRALVRLRSYLLFLARVGKNTFHPFNLLIVGADQLDQCLRATTGKRAHSSKSSTPA